MQPTISILMPSLNVAPYIERSLTSVLQQTLSDIEVICIDASSTDGTWETLQRYAATDERVVLLRSTKKSYGHQLNLGLDAARGEYVGIVETDDWVEPTMFQTLLETARSNDADMVKGNFSFFRTTPSEEEEQVDNRLDRVDDAPFVPRVDRSIFFANPAIWSGIYRRDMLVRNGIRLHEVPGSACSDVSYHFMTCSCAESAVLIEDHLYHHRTDNPSSSIGLGGSFFNLSEAMAYVEDFLGEHPSISSELKPFFVAWKFHKYRWHFEHLGPVFQWDFLNRFHQELARHANEGDLRSDLFEVQDWDDVCAIAFDPVTYFRKRGAYYATRPQGERLPQATVVRAVQAGAPDVSVIMTAYNEERRIRTSVESVLSQSLHNLELICVDDGSTDATLDVLCDLARKDGRISILRQPNEGPATARNHGLAVAHGRYVAFLDSDDTLRGDALESLVSSADAWQADVVFFGGAISRTSPQLEDRHPELAHWHGDGFTFDAPIEGIDYFCRSIFHGDFRPEQNLGFYRREFLEDHALRFIDGIYYEGDAFIFACLLEAHRVWRTNEQLYLRTIHDDAICALPTNLMHVCGILESIERVKELVERAPFNEHLDRSAASLMRLLGDRLCTTVDRLADRDGCYAKLSDVQRFLLDLKLDQRERLRLQQQLDDLSQRESEVEGSLSFRAGRILTLPARKTRDVAAALRRKGVRDALRDGLTKPEPVEVRPRALFISSDSYRMSGAFLSLIALNQELNANLGEQTTVILPHHGSGDELAAQSGVNTTVFASHSWIVDRGEPRDRIHEIRRCLEHTDNIKAAIDIARLALEEGCNVIHSNTSYTYVGYLAAKLAGIPHVWHLREFLEEDQNREYYDKGEAHEMLSDSDYVVAISEALRDKYAPVTGPERIRVIYNGIDEKRFYRPAHEILRSQRPVLLFVSGSKSPYKGRGDLIDACAKLKEQGYDFELWFVGWFGHDVLTHTIEANLCDRTKFFGYRQDTESFYEQADIFFMCSRFEAFGRTTVEAGLAGCLVVGTDSAGTAELVQDGTTGLLYHYGDVDGLAAHIARAFEDPTYARSVAEAGRAHFLAHFTARRNAENINQLHRLVVNAARPLDEEARKAAYERIETEETVYQSRMQAAPALHKELDQLELEAVRSITADVDKTDASETPVDQEGTKVSVIVPMAHADRHLEACLKSLAAQTFGNIEVICVLTAEDDDASKTIERYCDADQRFVVLPLALGSEEQALNAAMRQAQGDYIAFMEPHDIAKPELYERLWQLAIARGGTDIAKCSYCDYVINPDDSLALEKAAITEAIKLSREAFELWDRPELAYVHPSLWTCLYRREFLEHWNIRFADDGSGCWADSLFSLRAYCLAKTIAWSNEPLLMHYKATNIDLLTRCGVAEALEQTSSMLSFFDSCGICAQELRGAVYKRILGCALASQAEVLTLDDSTKALLVSQIQGIEPAFIRSEMVTEDEREAYWHYLFM